MPRFWRKWEVILDNAYETHYTEVFWTFNEVLD